MSPLASVSLPLFIFMTLLCILEDLVTYARSRWNFLQRSLYFPCFNQLPVLTLISGIFMSFHPRHFKKSYPPCLSYSEQIVSSILLLFIGQRSFLCFSASSQRIFPRVLHLEGGCVVFVPSLRLELSWALIWRDACSLKSAAPGTS